MAFFCFLLVFGIGTFQRVMSEKSKKNLQRLNSRPRLWAKRLEPMESSGLLSVRAGPFHGGRASVCSSEICVSRLPNLERKCWLFAAPIFLFFVMAALDAAIPENTALLG
jgi:hypothetical protein